MKFIASTVLIGLIFSPSAQGQSNTPLPPATGGKSTAFDRLVSLYHQGQIPDWSDFDPSAAHLGELVSKPHPNIAVPHQLVSLETGNELIGMIRRAGVFKLEITLEEGKACLVGKQPESCNSAKPLSADQANNAFFTTFPENPAELSQTCLMATWFRKVVTSQDQQWLIALSMNIDNRSICNPSAEGARFGETFHAAYFRLP